MEIGISIAFIAGILSFLSPCILPLVLPYISIISGISISEIKMKQIGIKEKIKITKSTLYFIIGFTLVFIMFGIIAGQVGGLLVSIKEILSRIAGIIVIILGLHIIGILKIPFLDYEKKFNNFVFEKNNFITAFVIGMTFAFGWTPCIGPILGGIISIAFYSGNTLYGGLLLGVYSLGLSIPFIIISIFIDSAIKILSNLRVVVRWVEIISGVILVLLGITLITNTLGTISNYILEIFPFLGKLG